MRPYILKIIIIHIHNVVGADGIRPHNPTFTIAYVQLLKAIAEVADAKCASIHIDNICPIIHHVVGAAFGRPQNADLYIRLCLIILDITVWII